MLRPLAMTAAVLLLIGCGSSGTYRVQTSHFMATYDRAWKIQREREGRVVGIRFKQDGHDLEVRVFGWLARHQIRTPNAEAMGRLWDEETVELRNHRPALRLACGEPRGLTLFGEERPVATLASTRWHTLVVSAQAEGSLVAVVARRPTQAVENCDEVRSMNDAVQALIADLRPSHGLPTPPHQTTLDGSRGVRAHEPLIITTPTPGEQRAD